jgi:hypothetical protein
MKTGAADAAAGLSAATPNATGAARSATTRPAAP